MKIFQGHPVCHKQPTALGVSAVPSQRLPQVVVSGHDCHLKIKSQDGKNRTPHRDRFLRKNWP